MLASMGPEDPLPLPEGFAGKPMERFVDSLLELTTSSNILQQLCGGVHVLDFFTRKPDLYSSVLPEDWRKWFERRGTMDILDLLMRQDLEYVYTDDNYSENHFQDSVDPPPQTLVQYIKDIRSHSLDRRYPHHRGSSFQFKGEQTLTRDVSIGMKIKKVEEVSHFAYYINQLTQELAATQNINITHLVDFGSGQNYLGRALASSTYKKHVIALESKPHNIMGAKKYDEKARLTEKPLIVRNKKRFRAEQEGTTYVPKESMPKKSDSDFCTATPESLKMVGVSMEPPSFRTEVTQSKSEISSEDRGSVQYVEFLINNGDLGPVMETIFEQSQGQISNSDGSGKHYLSSKPTHEAGGRPVKSVSPRFLVMSLHSCGNLVHHGIRSLLLNPCVAAVALVGCCYNLVTERLGPPTYKLPSLRAKHPRLEQASTAFDPHGFPMSERLCQYKHKYGRGIRLNITARMMAVQAPQNWGPSDSEGFFTRHFYRALLQRIFLDYGVVDTPKESEDVAGSKQREDDNPSSNPVIIGSLRKACYTSFTSYVRGALDKLANDSHFGRIVQVQLGGISDEEIQQYEHDFRDKKHEISVLWSLMAFSAGVIETIMVVDRWLFLKEQECVRHCWVEPVFDFSYSPRNLVVVGIKK